MKRETVLFYLSDTKYYIYFCNRNKEIKKTINTTSFLKYGEISSVDNLYSTIEDDISKNLFLKPNIIILYDSSCLGDIKYIYREVFKKIGINNIKFISINQLLKNNKYYKRLIVKNKNNYTVLKDNIKIDSLDNIDFKPIIIGEDNTKYHSFLDKDYIFNAFKHHFTNC